MVTFQTLTSASEQTDVEWTLCVVKPDACGRPWTEGILAPNEPDEEEEEPEEAEAEAAQRDPWVEKQEKRAGDMAPEIVKRIEKEGFRIVHQKAVCLGLEEARNFYRQHRGKPFYQKLVNFMSSGQSLALVLEKESAIEDFRTLMGPTDPAKAREQDEAKHPLNDEHWSLRSLFGTNTTRNAVHGSDSAFSAVREIDYFFREPPTYQRSALILSPELAKQTERCQAIENELEEEGYYIISQKSVELTNHALQKFVDTRSSLQSIDALASFTGGESKVMIVEKERAVPDLFLKVGPSSVAEAKISAPESLRARFAESDEDVAVHAVASEDTVQFVVRVVFKGKLPIEHTLAMIKPGTADTHYREIVRDLKNAKFNILQEKRLRLSLEEAEEFYQEHQNRAFYPRLTSYMSSGDIVALLLAKPSAIKCYRRMAGPTDPQLAQRESPHSFRARFGLDGTRNGVHSSDSPASAYREIQFMFPEYGLFPIPDDNHSKDFIRNTSVGSRFVLGKGVVPDTLHTVVTRGLVELAKAKPSGIEAIRWLGNWLLDNNPKTGCKNGKVESELPPVDQSVVVEEAADPEKFSEARRMSQIGIEEVQEEQEQKEENGEKTEEVSVEPIDWSHMDSKPVVVFVLGAPGTGKGTQCEKICEKFDYVHLSTGDLLRDEIYSGSELGQEIEAITKAGQLVSTNVVLALLRKAMLSSNSPRFLIDGFPRSEEQVSAFERMAGSPTFVLELTASEEQLKHRVLKRGETSGRADDNEESLQKRLDTFNDVSKRVIDIYRKISLVRTVDTTPTEEKENNPDEVFDIVAKFFQPELITVTGGPCSGKSRLAHSLCDTLRWNYIDVDELIRRPPHDDDENSLKAKVYATIQRGDIVADNDACELLRDEIYRINPVGKFVLDNYPRTESQRKSLVHYLHNPDFILNIHGLSEKVMLRRKIAKEKKPQHKKRRNSVQKKSSSANNGKNKKTSVAKRNGNHHEDGQASAAAKRALHIYNQSTQSLVNIFRTKGSVLDLDGRKSNQQMCKQCMTAFQPTVMQVLGGPGSGKTTQSKRISECYGFECLSVGDILKAEIARDTYRGKRIKSCVDQGQLVPTNITLDVLENVINNSHSRTFVVDGFPRALDQVEEWERRFGSPGVVLYLDCSDDEMRERYAKNSSDSSRFEKQFEEFQGSNMEVLDHYARTGRVINIDATADEDYVFTAIKPYVSPNIVCVLGGPGSGKGTQCQKIAKEMGYLHLSAGDIIHSEICLRTKPGLEAEQTVDEGELVSSSLAVELVTEAIRKTRSDRILLDGFPRDMKQLELFEKLAFEPRMALYLSCSDEVMKGRISKKPKQEKRRDDTEEAVQHRIENFHERTLPVIESLRTRQILKEVTAEDIPDEVFKQVRKVFQPEFVVLLGASGSGRGSFSSMAGKQLGYHRLRVTHLLKEEAELESDSPYSEDIKLAFATNRTAPLDATIHVIRNAVQRSHAQRFILDGFPRVVSQGYPSVQDMVFAVESELGRIRGAVVLDVPFEERKKRLGVAQITHGIEAQLSTSVDTFSREKLPVTKLFAKLGKLCTIDATATIEDVYEQAKPFIE